MLQRPGPEMRGGGALRGWALRLIASEWKSNDSWDGGVD